MSDVHFIARCNARSGHQIVVFSIWHPSPVIFATSLTSIYLCTGMQAQEGRWVRNTETHRGETRGENNKKKIIIT